MPIDETTDVLHHLRKVVLRQDGAGLSDGQLLECFVSRRDDAAFEALVRRHGPMVLGVCRRVLGHVADAEDAFQATFLVLVRKAATVMPRELVGNWLYGVAHRTALEAKVVAARRRSRERQMTHVPDPEAPQEGVGPDWRPLLDEELSRLPDNYRVPVVLCDLEGRKRKDVARQLGIPEGTLSSRLATARRRLAKRLLRHGLTLTGGVLAAMMAVNTATARVPVVLMSTTLEAARKMTAGGAASAVASGQVRSLMEGVLKSMMLSKLKVVTALLLLIGLLGTVVGVVGPPRLDARAPGSAGQRQEQPKKDEPKDTKSLQAFYKLYVLPEGEVLRRIAPPFPECRMTYYRTEHAGQEQAIPRGPAVMYFRWRKDNLTNWGMSFCGGEDCGETLPEILRQISDVYPEEIEGEKDLIKEGIKGDFIVREGIPAEKVLSRLEEVLRKECQIPVKLSFREVERKVIVGTRWMSTGSNSFRTAEPAAAVAPLVSS
jgi:RNA polymerase sigma factor (sigma-70 family)